MILVDLSLDLTVESTLKVEMILISCIFRGAESEIGFVIKMILRLSSVVVLVKVKFTPFAE